MKITRESKSKSNPITKVEVPLSHAWLHSWMRSFQFSIRSQLRITIENYVIMYHSSISCFWKKWKSGLHCENLFSSIVTPISLNNTTILLASLLSFAQSISRYILNMPVALTEHIRDGHFIHCHASLKEKGRDACRPGPRQQYDW